MMKAAQIKLPFGLDEHGNLVHIADAERGVEFHYFCPSCRSQLVSVKGDINQHHFRHLSLIECKGGLESAIHLAAKKVMCEEKQITLPTLERSASARDSRGKEHRRQEIVVHDGTLVIFDSVQEEQFMDEMRYDLLAIAGKTPLIIEICYTHKVDDQKINKIVKANKSAVELNLSDITAEDLKNMELFRSFVKNPKRIKWLHSVRGEFVQRKIEVELAKEIQVQEEKYKDEEIIKQRKVQREKVELLKAVKGLEMLSSEEHIAKLGQVAGSHSAWECTSKYLKCSLNELPKFLCQDVPNGSWIFGCDSRVWQAAFYSAFICWKGTPFSIKIVNDWLNNKAICKVPQCVETVGIYGRRYPDLIPIVFSRNIPSTWATLRAYFNRLCELGILEFSGYDSRYKGSSWFEVKSKVPLRPLYEN